MSGAMSSAGVSVGGADSPPSDLHELAAYTRREREKFETLTEAHQQRMRELMSTSIPLSPATPAPPRSAGWRPGAPRPAWMGAPSNQPAAQPSVHERLEEVQRHFDMHRQQQQPGSRVQAAY